MRGAFKCSHCDPKIYDSTSFDPRRPLFQRLLDLRHYNERTHSTGNFRKLQTLYLRPPSSSCSVDPSRSLGSFERWIHDATGHWIRVCRVRRIRRRRHAAHRAQRPGPVPGAHLPSIFYRPIDFARSAPPHRRTRCCPPAPTTLRGCRLLTTSELQEPTTTPTPTPTPAPTTPAAPAARRRLQNIACAGGTFTTAAVTNNCISCITGRYRALPAGQLESTVPCTVAGIVFGSEWNACCKKSMPCGASALPPPPPPRPPCYPARHPARQAHPPAAAAAAADRCGPPKIRARHVHHDGRLGTYGSLL